MALAAPAFPRLARGRAGKRLAASRLLGPVVARLQEAEPAIVHDASVLARAGACQLGIMLLDAGTVWVLLLALGTSSPVLPTVATYALAAIFRTLGILPGGLGTFDGALVLGLAASGVPVATGLSATLLFRGLSFWLPMLPGWWAAKMPGAAAARDTAPAGAIACSWTAAQAFDRLGSAPGGLSAAEAAGRIERVGPNRLTPARRLSRLGAVLRQLRNPLQLVLLVAAAASAIVHEWIDAGIVLAIVTMSNVVSASREYSSDRAARRLRERLETRVRVLRDGVAAEVGATTLVPGDVLLLSAGSLVPADALLLESVDLFVNEAVLTGESFPVQKTVGVVATGAPLTERSNCVFAGTNVRSGTARAIVVATGEATEIAAISAHLRAPPPETGFERGARRFGYLLTRTMMVMVLLVLAANVALGRPLLETLLFAVALAVGLSPELLPAILAVNLARGARALARDGVLVRHLPAIENLGSMDLLCTDKTGTLTEGSPVVEGAYDADGAPSSRVLELAALNAALQTGLANPMDEAILEARNPDLSGVTKLAEVPYDFLRKRMSVFLRDGAGVRMVTKGAFVPTLQACLRRADGLPLDAARRADLLRRFDEWGSRGYRVLAIAGRSLPGQGGFTRDDEVDLEFEGFVTFHDPPKAGVAAAIAGLGRLGVSIKLISGDAQAVARNVAAQVGMPSAAVMTGAELAAIHEDALPQAAERVDLFVEVDPNQKERIIQALRRAGHVVGFLGDGVNDAPAMHAADTGLSVDKAVDVAREAADFVLLEQDLEVIARGIAEGRRTFANTLKYILTTMSANLGNMISMAVASLFLPFLPLLAGQILLNNFLSDLPAVGLADDNVDPEMVARPREWDMSLLRKFMIEFGLLSTVFDFLTFGVLLIGFGVGAALFRTGWFVESLLTELAVALVVRTRRPFLKSRPGTVLIVATLATAAVALALPYLPVAGVFGFVAIPPALLAALVGITLLYVMTTEFAKSRFHAATW
jgi:Mg2+-importing ATPase